ncbi:MAG: MopE-related protein [Myxococcota bacterium]|nr:MopE-related protein [Myxococcota bacterium]
MTRLHWSFLMTAALVGCGDKEDADVDADGDGAFAAVDCDDNDATVYPGADELCDGLDNNCDEAIDEDAIDAETLYADNDGDSYGSGAALLLCDGSGYVSDNTDCNDSAADAYPGGTEVCDGLDNDCNGTIDEGSDVSTFYNDADSDGYGDAKDSVEACVAPAGYVDNSEDCNDYNDELNPETRWYPDLDGDGFGSEYGFVTGCEQPSGFLDNNEDCDDDSADTFPGAVAEDKKACMIDADGDGYGDNSPNPGVDPGTDCLDDDARIYPGNVAEDLTLCMQDFDLDGYGDTDPDTEGVDAGTDCDDADMASYPGATEYCNNADNDCNGTQDDDYAVDALTWYQDNDGDDYGDPDLTTYVSCDEPSGYTDNDEDCDDGDEDISPEAFEDCTDGLDNDCNGSIDEVCIYGTDDADVTFSGDSTYSYFGSYAIDAGDLNGDGSDDIVVGTYGTDSYQGAAYIFAGPFTAGDALAAESDELAKVSGDAPSDYFGYQIDIADVNGDGYDDLISSAIYAEKNTSAYSLGAIYTFYGPITGDISAANADLTYWGANSYDYYGYFLAEGHDIDGDGAAEVVGGSYYADPNGYSSAGILGIHSDGTSGDSYSSADSTIAGTGTYHYVGRSFDNLGDVDGDGNNDMLYGAYYINTAYVVYGAGTGTDYTSADADATFNGTSSTYAGISAASGDFNDDGYADVVIGSYGYSSYKGAMHYFYGPVSGTYSISSDYDAEISGESTYEYFGYYDSQHTVEDFDNDGSDDLLTGSYYNDSGSSSGGGAFLFYGAPSGAMTLSDADIIMYGDSSYYLGRGTSTGDLNDDGALDIVTGSYVANSYKGEAYVLFNGSF